VLSVEYIKTMKSSVLSAGEFFQLTVNSLLELCTHRIDGHRIVSIEGRLLLALETGNKVELNIQQQHVGNLSKPVKADDTNESTLVCYLFHSFLCTWCTNKKNNTLGKILYSC